MMPGKNNGYGLNCFSQRRKDALNYGKKQNLPDRRKGGVENLSSRGQTASDGNVQACQKEQKGAQKKGGKGE